MTERPADPASDLRAPVGHDEPRALLLDGEIDLEGRMLDASNVTLVGTIRQPVACETRKAEISRPARVPSGKSHSGRSPATGL